MANLHLVTGYAGYEHIKATDQAAFNAALIGTGQFVLEKGGIFEAQVQTNNLVRVRDGELMMQGRFIRLDPDTYVDLEIENGEQGKLRNDIIVARYTKNIGTGVEECNLVVIKGEAVSSNPKDPAHEEGDITNGVGTIHDYPLWRIPINGLNVGEPVALYGLPFKDSMHTLHSIREDVDAQLEEQKTYFAEQEALYEAAFEEQNEKFQKAVDAFGGYTKEELADTLVKIGDIKTTGRTDLGNKWLLCNGSVANVEDYPEIASVLTQDFKQKHFGFDDLWSGNSADSAYCVAYANGYWVIGGKYYDGSNYYGRIAYATSLDGEWTIKDLWSASKDAAVKSVAYANGYWVAVGRRFAGTGSAYGSVAYATNLDGEWNTEDMSAFNGGSSGDTKSGANSAVYANGYWVIGGTKEATRSTGVVLYATSPDGEWTKKEVLRAVNTNNGDSELKSLYYANGYWVVTGSHHPNSTSSALYAYIAYATSPDGTWTEKSMSTKNVTINCITYADGYWVAGDSEGNLYYAESLDGEWTVKSLCADSILGIAYANDAWYVVTENADTGICTSSILWDVFAARSLDSDRSGNGTAYAITVRDGKLVMAGKQTVLGTNCAGVFVENGDAILPAISADGTYVYIKAKE